MTSEMIDVVGDAAGARAPFTASIPEWAGCLRWRSACRSAAAVRCCGRSCRSVSGMRSRSPARSAPRWRLDVVIPLGWLRWPIAGVLVSLGVLRFFRHRHPRWGGHARGHGRAHGVVVPDGDRARRRADGGAGVRGHVDARAGEHTRTICMPLRLSAGAAFFATGLHAVGYLAVTAFVAVLVFEKLGVGILRRAWFNLDLIWSAALVATGTLTLML